MNPHKIMVVEDDREIRELIGLYLAKERYDVVTADNGTVAMDLLERESPDLVILDIVLPGEDGMAVCRSIRAASDVPVIFLTCKRDSGDIIAGLETGGDDYITKPFDPNVLVARIKAGLRRSALREKERDSARTTWRSGNLEVDMNNYDVKLNGEPVQLFVKERQLLLFLIQHPNHVFSVRQLHEQIWGWDNNSDERTVMVHISNLRRKIEADPAKPAFIHTVRGFGYKFVV